MAALEEIKKEIECALDVADGWAPFVQEWSKTKEIMADMQQRAEAMGRDPASLEFFVYEESIPDQEKLAEMAEAEITRVVITIFGQSREDALPLLDKLADLTS